MQWNLTVTHPSNNCQTTAFFVYELYTHRESQEHLETGFRSYDHVPCAQVTTEVAMKFEQWRTARHSENVTEMMQSNPFVWFVWEKRKMEESGSEGEPFSSALPFSIPVIEDCLS